MKNIYFQIEIVRERIVVENDEQGLFFNEQGKLIAFLRSWPI